MGANRDGEKWEDDNDELEKNNHEEKTKSRFKRTTHTKVRSGCLTCKKRRVKCDERRPFCLRCEKFGAKCDGYRRLATTVVDPPKTQPRPLIPRKRAASPLTDELKKVRFGNNDEMRYFRLFVEKTSLHLSGYYDPSVWGRIVLQASEAEDSIRHGVISIGALDMTTLRMRDFGNAEAKQHHLFALKQYSKAISDMRAMVLRQKELHDLQTALVASILIVCFETYHGNYASAAQQIRTGVRLIEDQKQKKDGSAGVDEDLIRAFDRLDVQSMSHSDPFTLEEHIALKNIYEEQSKTLPPEFLDLKTARDHFNFISRRACHFASMAWKLEHSTEDKKPSHSLWDPANADWRAVLAGEMTMFVDLSERWMTSFLPLYTKSRKIMKTKYVKPLSKSILAPLAMANHFLCMRLALRHFKDVDEIVWDNSMPEFIEIMENAEVIVENKEHAVFSFDLQSVWPLDVVAKKCRDPKIRRRAIQLLKEKPRREGIWDSIVAAIVCEWIVNVEEEGMLEDGTIPESARVRNIGVELDSENRQAKVWCYLPSKDGQADKQYHPSQKREAYLEWGSNKWNGGFGDVLGGGVQPAASRRNEVCDAAKQSAGMGIYFNARKFEQGGDHQSFGISTDARPVSF